MPDIAIMWLCRAVNRHAEWLWRPAMEFSNSLILFESPRD
jgi:hypothetical protein